jgi:hypothetical protein
MTKRSTLSQALKKASGKAETPIPSEDAPPAQKHTGEKLERRVGMKPVSGFFDKAVSKQIHQIALDEDTTLQELLREAINDLFEKRGKARIA